MQIRRSLVVVLVGAGVAAVAAGCGGGSDDSSATAATSVTRSEVTDPPTTAAPTTAPPATTAPATTSAPPPADGGGDGGDGGGGDEVVLPDAVGLDLQLAQDTMQASGFYVMISHDASGEGRMQILDRNWKVCDQTPAGGAPTSPATVIDFGAVKDDEACP